MFSSPNACNTIYLINFREAENAVQVTKSLYNIKNTLAYPNTVFRFLRWLEKSGIKAVVKKKHPHHLVKYYRKYLDFVNAYKNWIKRK